MYYCDGSYSGDAQTTIGGQNYRLSLSHFEGFPTGAYAREVAIYVYARECPNDAAWLDYCSSMNASVIQGDNGYDANNNNRIESFYMTNSSYDTTNLPSLSLCGEAQPPSPFGAAGTGSCKRVMDGYNSPPAILGVNGNDIGIQILNNQYSP